MERLPPPRAAFPYNPKLIKTSLPRWLGHLSSEVGSWGVCFGSVCCFFWEQLLFFLGAGYSSPTRCPCPQGICGGDSGGRWVTARRCFEGHLMPLPMHVPFRCPAWLVTLFLGGVALVPTVCARLVRSLWTVTQTAHVCRWVGAWERCTSVTH